MSAESPVRFALRDLRHLYEQMLDGRVRPDGIATAARGLLGPAIERIERGHSCDKCGYNPDAKVLARWEFVVDRPVHSLNAYRSNHGAARFAYKRDRDTWAMWFDVARRKHSITFSVALVEVKRRVTLTRLLGKRERPYDRDNLAGGCKVVVDAMVRAGLLADDTADAAEIHYAQERASNGKAGLRVLLEELAP